MAPKTMCKGYFSTYLKLHRDQGALIVQPRMGFSNVAKMRTGLQAVKDLSVPRIGTITLDAFTRQGDYMAPLEAMKKGVELNGYPIFSYGATKTATMLSGIMTDCFPVQMRHGTPKPSHLIQVALEAGIDATEGGPVSYCLPYGRTPLKESLDDWSKACQLISSYSCETAPNHLESFAGCLLGQLCPPSILIALNILESLFFISHGIKSLSVSHAQLLSAVQDISAISVLKRLANEFLNDVDWHVVFYTYMGVYPKSTSGARTLLLDSVKIACASKCERMIVKTFSEAYKIPEIEDNMEALILAANVAEDMQHNVRSVTWHEDEQETAQIYDEAKSIILTVLNMSGDLSSCILQAFSQGILDIPFCTHPNNKGQTIPTVSKNGYLKWEKTGKLPFKKESIIMANERMFDAEFSSSQLIYLLNYMRRKYDIED